MNRRSFVKSAVTASAAALAGASAAHAADGGNGERQYIELRHWSIKTPEKNKVVLNFLKNAAIPSLKRAGIGRLGVFNHLPDKKYPEQSHDVYTVAAFDSLEQWQSLGDHFANDGEFLEAGSDYLMTEQKDPAYERIDSSLMIAFEGYPGLKKPRKSKDRIFELRRYESRNEVMAKVKIDMFNNGELDIFKKVGLDGVFYGEMLIGANMPNLTYMLGYDSMEERAKNFGAFSKHPDWNELKNVEKYKGTVSHIDAMYLKPAPFSQI
jgi:hypothetical protein